jgi:hypothetical protein
MLLRLLPWQLLMLVVAVAVARLVRFLSLETKTMTEMKTKKTEMDEGGPRHKR